MTRRVKRRGLSGLVKSLPRKKRGHRRWMISCYKGDKTKSYTVNVCKPAVDVLSASDYEYAVKDTGNGRHVEVLVPLKDLKNGSFVGKVRRAAAKKKIYFNIENFRLGFANLAKGREYHD